MADGSVPITAGSGTNIRAVTNSGVQSGAFQQVFTLADSAGNLVPHDPDGTLQVSPEPTSLLLDDFSAALSGNWTTGGTVGPIVSNGNASFSPSTTSNASSFMRTNGAFLLRGGTYLLIAHIVALEAAAVTNNIRWWGYAQQATTPSYATPLQNGAVFMIDGSAGALQAVIYSATSKTVVATLTRPTDAAQHRYEIRYRQSVIYWSIDGVTVASKTFPNLAVAQGLNGVVGSFNNSTAPSAAPVLTLSSFSANDLGGNNRTQSDGVLGWIQQTIKQGSNPTVAATDNPAQVQALVPGSTTVTGTAASGTAVTITLPAPATGLRHHVTSLTFERFAVAALTAAAAPIVSSAANHTFITSLPTEAAAQGTIVKDVRMFASPAIATAQATATTFTAPATTNVIWRVTATYYIAP